MIINHIWVEQDRLHVGATDDRRWAWEQADGASGADAMTLILAVLERTETGYVLESLELYCRPGEELRAVALQSAEELLDVAWSIWDKEMDSQQAKTAYFGHALLWATSDDT